MQEAWFSPRISPMRPYVIPTERISFTAKARAQIYAGRRHRVVMSSRFHAFAALFIMASILISFR